jgi:hypothetical protein
MPLDDSGINGPECVWLIALQIDQKFMDALGKNADPPKRRMLDLISTGSIRCNPRFAATHMPGNPETIHDQVYCARSSAYPFQSLFFKATD